MVHLLWAVFAAMGVIFSACYMLWMYQRVFLGRAPGMREDQAAAHGHDPDVHAHADPQVTHEHSGFHMPDLNGREWAALLPMIVLMVWMGVAAQTFLPSIGASNAQILSQTKGSIEQSVKADTGNEVAARAQ